MNHEADGSIAPDDPIVLRHEMAGLHEALEQAHARIEELESLWASDTETEWAVQEREEFDGSWGRIDDGSSWQHSGGQQYTEREAREFAVKRTSGIDPKLWRRVVSRRVTGWEPTD